MAILKSFVAVYYSGKVDFKSTILQPLPPKMIYIKETFMFEIICRKYIGVEKYFCTQIIILENLCVFLSEVLHFQSKMFF